MAAVVNADRIDGVTLWATAFFVATWGTGLVCYFIGWAARRAWLLFIFLAGWRRGPPRVPAPVTVLCPVHPGFAGPPVTSRD